MDINQQKKLSWENEGKETIRGTGHNYGLLKTKIKNKFQPQLHAKFKYQVDMDSNKFWKKYKKTDAKMELQFAEMLTSKIYMDYIKDLFNKETTMIY